MTIDSPLTFLHFLFDDNLHLFDFTPLRVLKIYLMTIDSRSGTGSPAICNSLQRQHYVKTVSQNIFFPQTYFYHNLLTNIDFTHTDLILPRTCPIRSASCTNLIFSSSGITLHPGSIFLHLNILLILCLMYNCCSVQQKWQNYLLALLCTIGQEKWPEQERVLSEKQNKSLYLSARRTEWLEGPIPTMILSCRIDLHHPAAQVNLLSGSSEASGSSEFPLEASHALQCRIQRSLQHLR